MKVKTASLSPESVERGSDARWSVLNARNANFEVRTSRCCDRRVSLCSSTSKPHPTNPHTHPSSTTAPHSCSPPGSMVSSPHIPSSFDPAVYLHSELAPQDALQSCSYSEDIEALHACIEEQKVENRRNKVVIQHNRLETARIFRSDEDHPIGISLQVDGHN